MDKPQYAILRFAKYKGPEIGRIEAHDERTKTEYEKVHRTGVDVLPQPGGARPVQFRMPQLPKPLQAELPGRDPLLSAV